MTDSRRLEDLDPRVEVLAREVIARCAERGVELLVYSTRRTLDHQARLWRRGRSGAQIREEIADLRAGGYVLPALLLEAVGPQLGRRVTGATPGLSLHQWGLAWDAVPVIGGAAQWRTDAPEWVVYGEEVERAGLVWGGRWPRLRDMPHAELTGVDVYALRARYLRGGDELQGVALAGWVAAS